MSKNKILLIATTCVSLFIAEILIRMILPQPGFVPTNSNQYSESIIPHPTKHYTYAPNTDTKVIDKDYQKDITINSSGLLGDEARIEKKVAILAAGNSFTAGTGVKLEESWPSQLELNINKAVSPNAVSVLNSGVPGYSLKQIRLHIEEYLNLQPRIVVLGIYTSRYWRINNPYVYFNGSIAKKNKVRHLRPINGGYLYSNVNNKHIQSIHFWTMENFYLGAYILDIAKNFHGELIKLLKLTVYSNSSSSFIPSVEEKLSVLIDELDAINKLLKNHQIDLVVLLVNHQEENGNFSILEKEYNDVIKSYCNNNRIKVFDPIPYFELFSSGKATLRLGKDHHWSKYAHAIVGEQMASYLLKHYNFN